MKSPLDAAGLVCIAKMSSGRRDRARAMRCLRDGAHAALASGGTEAPPQAGGKSRVSLPGYCSYLDPAMQVEVPLLASTVVCEGASCSLCVLGLATCGRSQ